MAAHQKKARRLGAHLVFIDESGFSLSPHVARTWGLRGQTPVLMQRVRHRGKVSVIAGLSLSPVRRRPNLFWQTHLNQSIDQHKVLAFLKQLARQLRGEVIVIWDNLNAHKSRLIKEYAARLRRLHLEYLPPYAPELNPNEWHWQDGKCRALANHGLSDPQELHRRVNSHALATRRHHSKLNGYLRSANLPWPAVLSRSAQ